MRYRLSEISDRDFGAAIDHEMDRRLDEHLRDTEPHACDCDCDNCTACMDFEDALDQYLQNNNCPRAESENEK
jgi:hypothetical protein